MAKQIKYSAFEIRHVTEGYLSKTAYELADELGRSVAFVRELIRLVKSGKVTASEESATPVAASKPERTKKLPKADKADKPAPLDVASDADRELLSLLRSSSDWTLLRNEFTSDELEFVQRKFIDLMHQFSKDEVLASEQTQILQSIRYEILMSRNLQTRREAREEITRLEEEIDTLKSRVGGVVEDLDGDDRQLLSNVETRLYDARTSEQARTTEYTRLQERHESLTGKLKGNREQRIKQIESSRETFLGVIRRLQQADVQQSEGREMELMRLASDAEYKRLGSPHRFGDDIVDLPILSSDTIAKENESVEETLQW